MKEIAIASKNPVKINATLQGGGAVGIVTDDVIDRTKCYTEAIVLALIPFKNKDIYCHELL